MQPSHAPNSTQAIRTTTADQIGGWLCLTAVRGLGWRQVLWMSVCNLGWNVVLSLASNATAYAVDRPEPIRHDRHGGDGNRSREAG